MRQRRRRYDARNLKKRLLTLPLKPGQFEVLIQAAEKAGLADFLSTESNITVFAPTDAAFAALLNDLGASSLDDINATTLKNILTYHVVDGVTRSRPIKPQGLVPSLNTNSPDQSALSLLVNVGNDVMINNAKVTVTRRGGFELVLSM